MISDQFLPLETLLYHPVLRENLLNKLNPSDWFRLACVSKKAQSILFTEFKRPSSLLTIGDFIFGFRDFNVQGIVAIFYKVLCQLDLSRNELETLTLFISEKHDPEKKWRDLIIATLFQTLLGNNPRLSYSKNLSKENRNTLLQTLLKSHVIENQLYSKERIVKANLNNHFSPKRAISFSFIPKAQEKNRPFDEVKLLFKTLLQDRGVTFSEARFERSLTVLLASSPLSAKETLHLIQSKLPSVTQRTHNIAKAALINALFGFTCMLPKSISQDEGQIKRILNLFLDHELIPKFLYFPPYRYIEENLSCFLRVSDSASFQKILLLYGPLQKNVSALLNLLNAVLSLENELLKKVFFEMLAKSSFQSLKVTLTSQGGAPLFLLQGRLYSLQGLLQGEHIVRYQNGDVFQGTFKDGFKEGTGAYKVATGFMYQGGFHQNCYSGHGIIRNQAGAVIYNGTFKWGKQEGLGTLYYANGNCYSGRFKNGVPSGYGTLRNGIGGIIYRGGLKANIPHGYGIFFYSNGDSYVGTWEEGKRHGTGKLFSRDGLIFEGQFCHNYPMPSIKPSRL